MTIDSQHVHSNKPTRHKECGVSGASFFATQGCPDVEMHVMEVVMEDE